MAYKRVKMEENKLLEVLESIGLTNNEAVVYLELIRAGKSSAGEISRRIMIHRTNIYDILNKLLKKGIVDQTTIDEKQIFYPVNPEDLLDYHKQKENELKKIIPEIKKIQNKPQEDVKVTISEGLNSVKNIILSQLDIGETIYGYGTSDEAIEMLEGFLKEFHRTRTERKIAFKRIYGIDSIRRVNQINSLEYAEARYLPSSKSKVSVSICGDKVFIFVWETPFSVIVIKNKSIAEAHKHNFEILWNEAIMPH